MRTMGSRSAMTALARIRGPGVQVSATSSNRAGGGRQSVSDEGYDPSPHCEDSRPPGKGSAHAQMADQQLQRLLLAQEPLLGLAP